MENIKISDESVKLDLEKLEKISEKEMASNDFTVYLCNMCNWKATKLKNGAGQIINLSPPIPKTCNIQDINTCVKQGAFLPLLICRCNDTSFGISLYIEHPKGVAGWTGTVNVVPDCGHTGVVIPMRIPDPA